jgi:hypothetical protein
VVAVVGDIDSKRNVGNAMDESHARDNARMLAGVTHYNGWFTGVPPTRDTHTITIHANTQKLIMTQRDEN